MKTYVLVVFMQMSTAGYDDGATIQFQEFNSLNQCTYVSELIKKHSENSGAYCVEK